MNITVYNLSSNLSVENYSSIQTALVPYINGVSNDWMLSPAQQITFNFLTSTSSTTSQNSVYILDSSDYGTSSFGYHVISGTNSYVKIFVENILNNGGGILNNENQPTISSILTQEIVEVIGKTIISDWSVDNNTGYYYTTDLSYPVAGNIILNTTSGVTISMSDYLLPSWGINTTASNIIYNKSNTLKSPFTIDSGGFAIFNNLNKYNLVCGSSMSSENKQLSNKELVEYKKYQKPLSKEKILNSFKAKSKILQEKLKLTPANKDAALLRCDCANPESKFTINPTSGSASCSCNWCKYSTGMQKNKQVALNVWNSKSTVWNLTTHLPQGYSAGATA